MVMQAMGTNGSRSLFPPRSKGLVASFRVVLGLFMVGLVVSGLSCFWLERETAWLLGSPAVASTGLLTTALGPWIAKVHGALLVEGAGAPFLMYGTDWLGFAHLVLAMAFLGPMVRPLRHRWVIDFGLLACAAVVPFALIAGGVREIPMFWRLVDCSFGVVGAAPLLVCRHYLQLLEQLQRTRASERSRRRLLRGRRRALRTTAQG